MIQTQFLVCVRRVPRSTRPVTGRTELSPENLRILKRRGWDTGPGSEINFTEVTWVVSDVPGDSGKF